ncbi:MAG: thiol-activated cytolysin family protein [Myxococcota bacterium]
MGYGVVRRVSPAVFTASVLAACFTLAACADSEFGSTPAGSSSGDGSEGDDGFDSDIDPPGSDESGDTGGTTDGGEVDNPAASEIDAYIIGLGTPETPAAEVVEGVASEPVAQDDYVCSTTDLAETKQFDKIVAFANNSGTLFPGAIIGGHSIADGTLTPKILDRAPLSFSASLEGVLDGNLSATLEEPSLSTFREAMSDILAAEVVGATPANIAFDIRDVHSEEQLSLALGLDVSWMTGDVSSSLHFDQEERNSRFVVSFTQAYYTVDIDPPGRPSDMLDASVTLEDVEGVVAGEPPAYVSSVTYGRVVYFTATSDFSSQELQAALDFGFSTGAVDVDGSVSLTHSEVLAQSHLNAFILGGDGNVAVQAIDGVEELREFVQSGGVYSKESPGAPIAYKLAYLADNAPAKFALSTDYEITECERATQNVRIELTKLQVTSNGGDTGGDLEIYGWVRAWDEQSNPYPLFERESDAWVTIGTGQQWPANGAIASHTVPAIPQPGHHLQISVNLREHDGAFNADDSFGDQVIQFDFEDGWRDDDYVHSVAADDEHVELHFALTPVP